MLISAQNYYKINFRIANQKHNWTQWEQNGSLPHQPVGALIYPTVSHTPTFPISPQKSSNGAFPHLPQASHNKILHKLLKDKM